jgi:phage shock protein C
MFCTRCGSELRERDRFCSQCGTNVATPHAQTSFPQGGAAPPARQLARSMYDKKIAGVCAGFAHYFDCDPTLMRVIWLILAFGTGLGFIGYIVGWIAMPKDYGPPVTSVMPSNAGSVQQL